jgi:hypothetical protein
MAMIGRESSGGRIILNLPLFETTTRVGRPIMSCPRGQRPGADISALDCNDHISDEEPLNARAVLGDHEEPNLTSAE